MSSVTLKMTVGMMFEKKDRNTFSQESTSLDSAARSIVAQMNLELDMFAEGTELMCKDFSELLDYCINSDGDVKLTIE